MAAVLDRRSLVRWLLTHGFSELPNGSSSHRHFAGPGGVKITIKGHGRQDVSRAVRGNIIKQLTDAGWDREQLRRELGGAS
jgi:predicted RNA binding protein YcfA (HicA-like mRNA interferase family)